MALTETQKTEMLSELFNSEKVNVTCSRHLYFGPVKGKPEIVPFEGCADCWKVFFIHELASTPPDERHEKLDELEEVLHKMVSMVEAGTWDTEIYPHAKIEFGEE